MSFVVNVDVVVAAIVSVTGLLMLCFSMVIAADYRESGDVLGIFGAVFLVLGSALVMCAYRLAALAGFLP